MSRTLTCALGAVLLAGSGGCGEFVAARVEGRVTCNGRPVPAGMVTFYPASGTKTPPSGWTGRAYLTAEGTYEASVFAGRWLVVFAPPEIRDLEEEAALVRDQPQRLRLDVMDPRVLRRPRRVWRRFGHLTT